MTACALISLAETLGANQQCERVPSAYFTTCVAGGLELDVNICGDKQPGVRHVVRLCLTWTGNHFYTTAKGRRRQSNRAGGYLGVCSIEAEISFRRGAEGGAIIAP